MTNDTANPGVTGGDYAEADRLLSAESADIRAAQGRTFDPGVTGAEHDHAQDCSTCWANAGECCKHCPARISRLSEVD